MKITIESTDKIVDMAAGDNAIQARVWQGQSESGIPVQCFVTRIAPEIKQTDPRFDELTAEFERELSRQADPRASVSALPPQISLSDEDPRQRWAAAIASTAQSIHEAAAEDDAAMQRIFDQLTRRLERAKLPNNGSYVATAAMFAAAVVCEDCTKAELRARNAGLPPDLIASTAFIIASAFATLTQHYLQEFMARRPDQTKATH